jgi:hypothetical protein
LNISDNRKDKKKIMVDMFIYLTHDCCWMLAVHFDW